MVEAVPEYEVWADGKSMRVGIREGDQDPQTHNRKARGQGIFT